MHRAFHTARPSSEARQLDTDMQGAKKKVQPKVTAKPGAEKVRRRNCVYLHRLTVALCSRTCSSLIA